MSLFDSEQMVIGAMLGDPRTIRAIRAEVGIDDFQTEEGRAIFRAACSLDDDKQHIDPVLIRQRAAEQGTNLNCQSMIAAMEISATQANIHVHVQGMKDAILRSRLMTSVSSAFSRLNNAAVPAQIVCADLQTEIQTAVERDTAHVLVSSADAMSEYIDFRLATESGQRQAFIPTGYNALDNALGGGMVTEGFYILAARPGCGKTTLALQIAEKAAEAGVSTLFVSLEMAVVQLTARRLANMTGISSGRILLHSLAPEEHEQVAAAMDELAKHPLFFNSVRRATVGSIGILARQVKNCGLVVVDYLGLLQYEPGKGLYEQVTKTSNALKRLACSLGIPVLCLAQLNRETEGRKGPPRLSDLRDSGAIEQDADDDLRAMVQNWQDLQLAQAAASEAIAGVAVDLAGQMDEFQQALAKDIEDMDLGEEAANSGIATIQGYIDGASGMLAQVKAAYRSIAEAAQNELSIAGATATLNFNAYASGTQNAAPGLAVVGENGPELVYLNGGEKILDAAQTSALQTRAQPALSAALAPSGGSNISVSVNIPVNGNATQDTVEALREYGNELAKTVTEQVMDALEEERIDAARRAYR